MATSTQRPYSGIRIVDLARELGSYATRLFADLGAEVIRVEPPAGRDDRRAGRQLAGGGSSATIGVPFMFLAANKKSVIVDYTLNSGRAVLRDLVATADIVVYEADSDRDWMLPTLASVAGTRVITAVSYFGLTGPYRDYLGCDLVAQSLGGIAWLSGEPDQPPLRIAGEQSYFVTSLYAAAATAVALWDAEGRGNSHVLDVSAQECIAHSLQNAPQVYDLEGRIPRRGGEGTRDATEGMFACKDGYVLLASTLTVPASWRALIGWLQEAGHPGGTRLAESDWQDRAARLAVPMRREFCAIFESFIADRTRSELTAEALARRITLAPVSSIADQPADPQLVFRQFFQDIAHPALGRHVRFPGAPYRLSEPVWSVDRCAPAPGEDNDAVLGAAARAESRSQWAAEGAKT